jgi:hypothetical protein
MIGQTELPRIATVEVLPEFQLRIRYSDGMNVRVDFRPIIQRGGVFARLGDAAFFSQVQVDNRGRSVYWPGEIDFCADALRQTASTVVAA